MAELAVVTAGVVLACQGGWASALVAVIAGAVTVVGVAHGPIAEPSPEVFDD